MSFTATDLGIHSLPLFVLSGLLLNLTPGADTLFILSRSAALGMRAGVAAGLGIVAGCLLHTLAAALGLSALLATSAQAFKVLKWLGAAYLVWLGLGLWRGARTPAGAGAAPVAEASWGQVMLQGLLTNLLNPKVALFFLAFVPQFIAPTSAHKAWAFIVLGLVFNAVGLLWCLLLAWAGAHLARLRLPAAALAWLKRGVGALFVGLGLKLALSPAQS